MRNKKHYEKMLDQNPETLYGASLAAACIYAARYGVCEGENHQTPEYKTIIRYLIAKYGETLDAQQIRDEMQTGDEGCVVRK